MARNTSIEAYNQIKEDGLLKALQWKVYSYLYTFGPLTGKQVCLALSKESQNSGVFTTRLSELKRRGVVEEVGKVTCDFSGRKVLLWDVTKELPSEFQKAETKDQKIKRLRKVIIKLETQLKECKCQK